MSAAAIASRSAAALHMRGVLQAGLCPSHAQRFETSGWAVAQLPPTAGLPLDRHEVNVECVAVGATSAVAAAKGGASRVELCSNVAEGGTTPSAGAIGAAAAALGPYSTTLHVLVRPRAGDFVYDGLEIDEMRRDISAAATAGAHGVVIGALRPDGTVCTATLRLLLAVARGRSLAVTFHRAIDHVPDQMAALDAIAECGGVDYVLTSGGAATARAGADSISRMVAKCSRRNPGWTLASTPRIVAASGVGVADSPALVAATGVQDVHMGSAVATEVARGPVHAVAMGRGSAGKEHLRRVVDPAKVRAAVEMLGGQWKRARTA